LTSGDASDSVGCTTTMDSEADRLRRIRWCQCGQPWIPAAGLYGTTEETGCAACILRRLLAQEREAHSAKASVRSAKAEAFAAAVAECESYSKGTTSAEAKAVALNIAMRITRRAKQ